jgi:hypothetical protein
MRAHSTAAQLIVHSYSAASMCLDSLHHSTKAGLNVECNMSFYDYSLMSCYEVYLRTVLLYAGACQSLRVDAFKQNAFTRYYSSINGSSKAQQHTYRISVGTCTRSHKLKLKSVK